MAKIVAEAPVKKEITKKRKLKQKKPKPKNLKASPAAAESVSKEVKTEPKQKKETKPEENVVSNGIPEELSAKYPILKNEELIKKFLSVNMTNNQKGRIRQLMKEGLKQTTESLLPDVINNKIQSIMKEKEALTESDLKRIRILYNMLKLSLQTELPAVPKEKKKKSKKEKAKKAKEVKDKEVSDVAEVNNKPKEKVKGPKRYVVFVGNLAPDVDKEKLMKHFSELSNFIVDIRIPVPAEGKKARIAYLEMKNESSYELALSKHHTMLSNRRINVLYSTQKNSKISKTEAKSKSAKLIALQKSGKLAGSIPMNKKRSQRRMKAKLAQAKLEQP